jgi:hypothetical protein
VPSFALALLLFDLDAAANTKLLAQRANQLYRAENYAEACPLFQQVTELTPSRGAAWAELGLCLARVPAARALAVALTQQAILLSPRDAKTRKAAYYNLGRFLGETYPSHVPGPTEEGPLAEVEGYLPQCELFDRVPGCDRQAWGCSSRRSSDTTLARFALDPRTIAKESWPDTNLADTDLKVLLARDVLAMSDGWTDVYRSGTTTCRFGISCRVVWADACNARLGYYCETQVGPSVSDPLVSDLTPCTVSSREAGELVLR